MFVTTLEKVGLSKFIFLYLESQCNKYFFSSEEEKNIDGSSDYFFIFPTWKISLKMPWLRGHRMGLVIFFKQYWHIL